jgi:hypothetical protein
MKLAMEIFPDEETGQWGYAVPALSIVGTGCKDKVEARNLGYQAIEAALQGDDGGRSPESEVVLFEVELRPGAEAV